MVKWQIRCDPDVPDTFRVFRPGADEPLPGYCWSIKSAYDRIDRRVRRDRHLAEICAHAQGGEITSPINTSLDGVWIATWPGYSLPELNHPIQEPCS